MLPQWIIEKKRDGVELSEEEIHSLIAGYTDGTVPDYQMSAFAMAVFMRGMTFAETAFLTDAMMKSGDILDISHISKPKADKHSTGGIGDKVSLVLAPLVACCGVVVPMLSGRGLGITGGTLDKLESIPGYRTNLSTREFLKILQKCGCSIMGQTAELAPADKKLYALRDVTGTVPSIPLIAASIMSKKLAEGTDVLTLDVKCGKGAFMKTLEQARELARTIVEIGARSNTPTNALVTDMNQPLGRTVGNALEVVEAVETLRGNGSTDLLEETIELSAEMLILTGTCHSKGEAAVLLKKQIDSGAAYEKFKEMITLHGGSPQAIDKTSTLPSASIQTFFSSPKAGYIVEVNAEQVGRACIVLGAGRKAVDEDIDHAVGISKIVKVGEWVERDQPLMLIHANDQTRLNNAVALLKDAVQISDKEAGVPSLILDRISI
ncbi:MAG: thymidine phosphorylase [Lentisphaerae bacterium]|nr:thymidine phosphorylase [Lentisphaerota bacterium]